MAPSKKTKRLYDPKSNETRISEDPNKYFQEKPSWKFNLRDKYCWQFSKDNVGDEFWDRILGHFDSWESQTWQDILVASSKQNHHIEVNRLNKLARDRLQQLHIEVESVVSLRLSGNHRLYGIMDGSSFCIIWFDNAHGDNETCVCRSHKRGT